VAGGRVGCAGFWTVTGLRSPSCNTADTSWVRPGTIVVTPFEVAAVRPRYARRGEPGDDAASSNAHWRRLLAAQALNPCEVLPLLPESPRVRMVRMCGAN
jgi:hypothetical protein